MFARYFSANFIYDYINVIPFMLKEAKFRELAAKDSELEKYYTLQDNGFYKVDAEIGSVAGCHKVIPEESAV